MQCPRCQQESPADADFCPECGAKLAVVCASCATANAPTHKFCKKCGQRLGSESGLSRPPGRFTSAESYTPRHLADRILTSKAALEGERKQVTVLFADLKGSMELLADRDPEEARKILDPVLEHMMEAVHRYEGTVNQVMGDGIMALFGAPLAHEDHAVRACYAALRMQETVRRHAEGVFRTHGLPVQIRVGLNSGEVVVRAIGSDLHMDYSAIGQTTHLAARMEQMAQPGAVLLTPDTLRLAEGFLQVSSRGAVPVKGLAEPIEIFELIGSSPARSRLHATASRGLTKFVGRNAEIGALFSALENARTGRGQILGVVGEPGVGKSRLVWEFTHSHRTGGCLVLEGASVSYGKATTYLPLIDLLKRYFAIEPRDDARKMREKVTGKLFSLDRTLESCRAPLSWLLDIPVEEAGWDHLAPPQRRQRLHDGLRHLFLRESREQPLVLMFEDLHWIDSETQALLDGLVESLPTMRTLLLVNYRPEFRHSWGGKTYYTQLRLDPLPEASVAELLAVLLGPDPSLEPLSPLLIARTEGNPFFLEETVQSLVETGALSGERGAYRLRRALQTLSIPATAQTILAARIDRLEPEDKRLLQTASVIGKDVSYPLLRAITDDEESVLRASLARLLGAEFLYEVQLFPELEYTFKHALTHEVVYSGMTNDRRRALDAAIVEAIEHLAAERLAEQVERLASHAFRGEVWPKASMYLQKAAARAAARCAYRQVVADLARALIALEHLPEKRETVEQFIDVKLALRSATLILGDPDAGLMHARDALLSSERLQDNARIALSCTAIAHILLILGRCLEAQPVASRALEAADAAGDRNARLSARMILGGTYWILGNYHEGKRHYEITLAMIRADALDSTSAPLLMWQAAANSRAWMAFILVELGEFDRALQIAQDAARQVEAREIFHPLPRFALALSYVRRGETHSIPDLERGLGLCREMNHMTMLVPYTAGLGTAYTLAGRVAEGIALLEEALDKAEVHNRANRSLFQSWLSQAYLLAAQPEDAIRVAREGLAGARDRHERGEEAWNLRGLAEAFAYIDPQQTDVAERYYTESMALADELGMRPVLAHCHAGLAKLYRRVDKRTTSGEHFAAATSMFRDMGMTYYLEKAEAEMRTLDGS